MNLRKGMGNQELPDRGGEGVKLLGGGGGVGGQRKKKTLGCEATAFFLFPKGFPETKGQGTAKGPPPPHCIQLALQSTTSLPPITSKCLLRGV